jgi:hypothetical protein
MNIQEQDTKKLNAGELARYREELLSQLSSTLEYLHKANLETNSRYEECIHITSEDIRDECYRNGLNI